MIVPITAILMLGLGTPTEQQRPSLGVQDLAAVLGAAAEVGTNNVEPTAQE